MWQARQVADELHAMAPRTAGPRLGGRVRVGRVRVEAPPSTHAHQESGARLTKRWRQLDRVVASVQDEPGQGVVDGQVGVGEEGGDLLGGHRVALLLRVHPPHAHGSGPTLPRDAQVGNPGRGPAGDDGLARRRTRRLGVPAPFGAGLRVAAGPDADIHRVDRLTVNHGLGGKRTLKRATGDRADRQRVLPAAPAALMLRLDAEHWQRGDGSSRQQGVTPLAQGLPPMPKGGLGRGTKGRERGKGSGFHLPYFVTLRRSPEAPQHPLRG